MLFDLSQLTLPVDNGRIEKLVLALAILVFGALLARFIGRSVRALASRRLAAQEAMIAGRLAFYLIFGGALLQALHHAGVDLSVFVGAAGIVTLALGFAAQTSVSNVISGLFLMGEKPFVLDDQIQVGQTVGEVISIDLLSVKLRTFDNVLVRIPNETLLKSEIKNLTRFPIRRLDIPLDVDLKTDIEQVRKMLEQAAASEPLCLDEPRPQVACLGFGEASIQLRFSVWTATSSFLEARNRVLIGIKQAFEDSAMPFPSPQRVMILQPPPTSGTEMRSV